MQRQNLKMAVTTKKMSDFRGPPNVHWGGLLIIHEPSTNFRFLCQRMCAGQSACHSDILQCSLRKYFRILSFCCVRIFFSLQEKLKKSCKITFNHILFIFSVARDWLHLNSIHNNVVCRSNLRKTSESKLLYDGDKSGKTPHRSRCLECSD